jgi:hypothetical protein
MSVVYYTLAQTDTIDYTFTITEENSTAIISGLELLQNNENEKIEINKQPIIWPLDCPLTSEQKTAIEIYQHNNFPLLSIYELQNVNVLTEIEFKWLLKNSALQNKKHWSIKDLIGKKYTNAYLHQLWRFDKNNTQTYLRGKIAHQHQNIKMGLAFENDFNEAYKWDIKQKQYGADLINFYFKHEIKKNKLTYLIGNYRIHGGQGLLVGAGMFFSKGPSMMLQSAKNISMVYPLANTSEYDRLFGGLIEWKINKKIQTTLYYSNVYLDATLYNNSYFSSINESGIHIDNKSRKNIQEQTYGMQCIYSNNRLNILYQNQLSTWNKNFQPSTYTYQKINSFGKLWYGQSLSVHYKLHNHLIFSEIAFDKQSDLALQIGIQSSLDKKINTLIFFRKYDTHYNAPHSMAFGESSKTQNETGLLCALQYAPLSNMQFYGSIDIFHFPWIKYQINNPSRGMENIMYVEKKFKKHSTLRLQYRYEEKTMDLIQTNGQILTRHHYNLVLQHKISTVFQFNYQYQATLFPENKSGTLHAITIKYQTKKLRINYQLAQFNTDSYTSRLYQYEQDVPYRFHFNVYYGLGVAHTCILQYKINPSTSVWLKIKILKQEQNKQKETIKDIGIMLKFLF